MAMERNELDLLMDLDTETFIEITNKTQVSDPGIKISLGFS